MTMTRDARALMFSVLASSVFAVGSLIWGFFAGSQMIIFDGLYSFVSVALSLLAVWARRALPVGSRDLRAADHRREGRGVGGPVPVRPGRRGRRPAQRRPRDR